MFSSADLIEALARRARRSLRPERAPGEFPPGWSAWFAAMTGRIGAVTGAAAEAIIAILLQREPAMPPARMAALNRWQAFGTLWRQEWQPPAREDRRERIIAYAITLVVHLILGLMLLWLAYVRFTGSPAPQGEDVVQVEYIGEGTPLDEGGGPPTGDVPEPAEAASAPASPASASPSQAETAQRSAQPPPPNEQPPASSAEASGAQPLQVTETAVPDTEFVLPPATPRSVDIPQPRIAVPEIQVHTREVELVQAPAPIPTPQPRALPAPEVQVPDLRREAPEVVQREVPAPLPRVRTPTLPQRALTVPELRAPAASVGTREIPMPSDASASQARPSESATGTTPTATTDRGNTPTGASRAPGGPPASQSGARSTAATSGSGPKPAAAPGAWPTPQRGDDWGASTRNRPGGNTGKQAGLFNADGSPRLPPGTAAPGGGFPPGSDDWTLDKLDRHGTWMKRPPNDYTPTRFDRYWLPSGTLLQEWVRRGIKSMAIPIPGTSKKINCTISILQLGGACGVSDPNLNDQEATARPPPDIPFKPELQEDQDSLRRPPGSP